MRRCTFENELGKSEGFDSWIWPCIFVQIRSKSPIFQPMWPLNLTNNLGGKQEALLCSWSYVCHFMAICELELELPSENAQIRAKPLISQPVWPWNFMDDLKKYRAPLLCYFKLCAPFHSHPLIQTGVTVWICPNKAKFILISVTFTFHLWPWPFALTSLLSMIISLENFMIIRCQQNVKKVWQTGRQTDGLRVVYRAAWLQLKVLPGNLFCQVVSQSYLKIISFFLSKFITTG